ncbi:MAG: ankyrin repeat domain-containing protein, partial [Verrucomicrobia bacterium]|nr:ankyrin repeat domain-containing protein [Verrucomicrobiota bacterium]
MKHLLLVFLVSTLSLYGQSPVLEAVRQSDHSRLQSLIEAQRDLNATDANGMTALHQAALQDDLKCVRMLLEGKVNPSVVTDYGITPLWLACQNGNASMVKTLLKAGAVVDQISHGK